MTPFDPLLREDHREWHNLPWQVTGPSGDCIVRDAGSHGVCEAHDGDTEEFIVQACNAYEGLVYRVHDLECALRAAKVDPGFIGHLAELEEVASILKCSAAELPARMKDVLAKVQP